MFAFLIAELCSFFFLSLSLSLSGSSARLLSQFAVGLFCLPIRFCYVFSCFSSLLRLSHFFCLFLAVSSVSLLALSLLRVYAVSLVLSFTFPSVSSVFSVSFFS